MIFLVKLAARMELCGNYLARSQLIVHNMIDLQSSTTHIYIYNSSHSTHAHAQYRAIFSGKWNEFFAVTKVDENGVKGTPVELWRKPLGDWATTHKWKYDPFVDKLTELTEEMENTLPSTDSRLRTDLRALSKFDVKSAGKEKMSIEERERRKRREREAQGKKWSPVYFKVRFFFFFWGFFRFF